MSAREFHNFLERMKIVRALTPKPVGYNCQGQPVYEGIPGAEAIRQRREDVRNYDRLRRLRKYL
jgi:hypothetical protein